MAWGVRELAGVGSERVGWIRVRGLDGVGPD